MTSSQHPYGKQGRHRAPVTPRPHLRRLVATVGLCMVAGLAILGATLGAHPTLPTVQAASPLQVAPIGPGRPRLLPGTVAVEAVGMREPAPANHPIGPPSATSTAASATTAATATTDTTAPTTTTDTTVPATTSAPSTTTGTAPTATPDGTPDPTPTTTETPMPTSSSVATCKAVTK